ncbi:MAG: enoyl-CoA hydratase-related protein [Acidimicrobiales bacterium]
MATNPQTIKLERHDRVVLVRIHRPDALNALNRTVLTEIVDALTPLDSDPSVGCFVITGGERAFAAGADIKEMEHRSHMELYHDNFLGGWDAFVALRTPKLAAVSGYALGGGNELAMMCDTIYAADDARFGQPEIKLGLIPGMGGTQRLTRLVGKAKAMDMILTGRMTTASEAEQAGLVARVFPADRLIDEVLAIAATIASYGKGTAMLARDAVNQSLEGPLGAGLQFERHVYHSIFSTDDAAEGIAAFVEKRDPEFKRS